MFYPEAGADLALVKPTTGGTAAGPDELVPVTGKAVEAEAGAPGPLRGLATTAVAVVGVEVVSIAALGSAKALEFLFDVRPFPDPPCPFSDVAVVAILGDWEAVLGAELTDGACTPFCCAAAELPPSAFVVSPLVLPLNASTYCSRLLSCGIA